MEFRNFGKESSYFYDLINKSIEYEITMKTRY